MNSFSKFDPLFLDFMMSASDDIISNYGKHLRIVSIVCRLLLSVCFVMSKNLKFDSFLFLFSYFLVDEKIFCCHGGLSPDLLKYYRVGMVHSAFFLFFYLCKFKEISQNGFSQNPSAHACYSLCFVLGFIFHVYVSTTECVITSKCI